jgi:hypothetical protein
VTSAYIAQEDREDHDPATATALALKTFRVRTRAWAGSGGKASFMHGFAAAAKYAR